MTRRRLLRLAALVPVVLMIFLVVWIGSAAVIYSPEYVRRVLVWQNSDVGDYLNHFPQRTLTASPQPVPFPSAPETERVTGVLQSAFGVDDFNAFLTRSNTQSFIVIKDGRVIDEQYANGWRRDSMVTSFSVAKSFVSTLIDIAIQEGYIHSLDDPITRYLPELAARDPRFNQITIRHLLLMSSGLDYQANRWFLFNGDDPLTTYYPDQRAISLNNTHIVEPPGRHFRYNKYHPQLLGIILERATGMSVTQWTQTRLWDPLGMEFDGAWCLDSTGSGFEKMEAGLNARAIDFAKLGQLYLQHGEWNGRQILSPQWIDLATGVNPADRAPSFSDRMFYGLMWWGINRPNHAPDYSAEGDHGQFIFVSPANHVVIVRTGVEYGIDDAHWFDALGRTADELGQQASGS